ncbi:hypothetical protein PTSG_00115 [Salpingoeca rosetta]|uniref:SMB domain-containing protein n=1 Tax=Salpingoeca rosetta (strain ATCC 50818 / BSB-021) TaxID=946362 RepID=F2TVK3_SALR5|nr:uncharacterized protein PTSG_00115 [Salpingoeca rosetta]EGD72099.1 hypothetical protein PTSG_00115 [Salpingoeca rosetta]|eukprot:XP_004998671.1 hypothetical protein PTSG_00115 [Salpingoeca rosetta]
MAVTRSYRELMVVRGRRSQRQRNISMHAAGVAPAAAVLLALVMLAATAPTRMPMMVSAAPVYKAGIELQTRTECLPHHEQLLQHREAEELKVAPLTFFVTERHMTACDANAVASMDVSGVLQSWTDEPTTDLLLVFRQPDMCEQAFMHMVVPFDGSIASSDTHRRERLQSTFPSPMGALQDSVFVDEDADECADFPALTKAHVRLPNVTVRCDAPYGTALHASMDVCMLWHKRNNNRCTDLQRCDPSCVNAGDCCSDYVSYCINKEVPDAGGVLPGDNKRFQVHRLGNGPIINADTFGLDPYWTSIIAANINGPSLIKVPSWVSNPLGRYYLYFAHHKGAYIRLAFADHIAGPYTIYDPGVLQMEDGPGANHIASPDIIIDEENQLLRMYFHQPRSDADLTQFSYVAMSTDGLQFVAHTQELGPPYFRVFRHDNMWYAYAKDYWRGGIWARSEDGLSSFELGNICLQGAHPARHTAVWVDGHKLYLFYSRIYDTPETIYVTMIDLRKPWEEWECQHGILLIKPEHDYEGANVPVRTSYPGVSYSPVHELRDPAIYEEDGRVYLVYSVQGELGLAIAEITWTFTDTEN